MVGEALVVSAREGGVDRCGRLALPRVAEHLLEDTEMQFVDVVVGVADGLGEPKVLRAQELGEFARDLDVELAHAGEGGCS